MMLKEAVLALFGLKLTQPPPPTQEPVVQPPDSGELSHNQVVHDLHNVEAVALAGFELQVRKSARVNRLLMLGETAEHVRRSIDEDSEKMRNAISAAVKRQK